LSIPDRAILVTRRVMPTSPDERSKVQGICELVIDLDMTGIFLQWMLILCGFAIHKTR
jgi:hypothetical protein